MQANSQRRKGKRTGNACDPCRTSKIKCSGELPCHNCVRRYTKCHYSDGGNQMVQVSKRFISELKRQAESGPRQQDSRSPTGPVSEAGDPKKGESPWGSSTVMLTDKAELEGSELQPDYTLNVWTNPFKLPSTTIQNIFNDKRTWIWLAPWSNWSFTIRLTLMITDKLGLESPFNGPTFTEHDCYAVKWKVCRHDGAPNMSGLPSLDHALFLFSTFKFHLGQNYRLIDEEEFLKDLHEFYQQDVLNKVEKCRLWFIQYLLVLAFGKAFLGQSKNPQDPPGVDFFARAMDLMPDIGSLWKESLRAVETLALVGLYLYSIDHRESAHIYINHAVCIARMEGLHTPLQEESLGSYTIRRCRALWWSLYNIEHHLAVAVGLGGQIKQGEDDIISMEPNGFSENEDETLRLQVKLTKMHLQILSSIYKTEKQQLGTFLYKTHSIMHAMAGHAQDIEQVMKISFQNDLQTMPRGTRHVSLLYHQCVLVATQPLLLSILKERLEKLGHGKEDWESFLSVTTSLISTGIKSAVKILQILSYDDSLLEIFLPFDLEFVYKAATYLIMANTLFPTLPDGKAYLLAAHSILDKMVNKGNLVAQRRKEEVLYIEHLFTLLAKHVAWRNLEPLRVTGDQTAVETQGPSRPDAEEIVVETGAAGPFETSERVEAVPEPVFDSELPNNLDYLDSVGISSNDFFSIADQIEHQNNFDFEPMMDRPWTALGVKEDIGFIHDYSGPAT